MEHAIGLDEIQEWAAIFEALHARTTPRSAGPEFQRRALACLLRQVSTVKRKESGQLTEQAGKWNADAVHGDL